AVQCTRGRNRVFRRKVACFRAPRAIHSAMISRMRRRAGIAVLACLAGGAITRGQEAPVGATTPQAVIARTCAGCHHDPMRGGAPARRRCTCAGEAHQPTTPKKMTPKLRSGRMPPAGARRDETALAGLAAALEAEVDAHAATSSPGRRTFQRLNRAEYEQSIH